MRPHGFRRSQVYKLLRKISVAPGASEYSAEWVQGEAHPWQGGYIATFFEKLYKRIANNVYYYQYCCNPSGHFGL